MVQEIFTLTKEMVAIPSVNTTAGEKEIGLFIEQYLRKIPYFIKHPKQVIVQELPGDSLHRRNVFALLLGEKQPKADTIILHGHTDTVGVDDFGALKEYAFSPDELMAQLRKLELPEDVRKDLESGDYLFGRGSCDMKSGDAVFMVLAKHLAERIQEWSGNILLSFNPVEENLHTGIIAGCDILLELKEEYGLNYLLAINNDYTCPMYPGDKNHYIYTGVVGKLLPCFYIQGKETHVGQCFEGFDASAVAAGLVRKINLNRQFCDGYQGEYSLPPAVLKMKDLKPWYNVQTAKEALVYFNYFVHNAEITEILGKLKAAAAETVEEIQQLTEERYRAYCQLSGQDYQPLSPYCQVMTYEELYNRAAAAVGEQALSEQLGRMTEQLLKEKTDQRELPVALIREMLQLLSCYQPVVVLYFAAPYCPHNTLQKADAEIEAKLRQVAGETGREEQITYKLCRFFPSLSDSSYLKIDDSDASVELLTHNFPQMQQLYPVPLDKIKLLNIPAVNFGVYGKDAHKWTERVYMPYSFGVLPKLLQKTLRVFLEQ